jgi:hypothetical protein
LCPHSGKAFLTASPGIDFTSVLPAVVVPAINPRELQAQARTAGLSLAILPATANAGDAVLHEFVGEASATHSQMTLWIKCLQAETLS